MKERFDISVVVPFHNEQANLAPLVKELTEVANQSNGFTWEFIFVDDGSDDSGADSLRDEFSKEPRLKLISLSQNYGQTAALAVGFRAAKGSYVASLDSDGQNDPADIPKLLTKLQDAKADVACGWRKERHDDTKRVIPSRIANWLIRKSTGVPVHDLGCTLRVYTAKILSDLHLYGQMHRLIPALLYLKRAKFVEMEVNHRERWSGHSKYSLSRTGIVLLDLIVLLFFGGFATRPLHLFGGIGASIALLGALFVSYLASLKFFTGADIGQRPLLIFGVLFILTGIQFIFFGLLAEIMIRIYHESKTELPYLVRSIEPDRSQ